jgi:uncharacterized membrane protein YkvA (DUF1232 family)
MTESEFLQHELFVRTAEQLSKVPSATDHLMLTKWRALSICQYLLGKPTRRLDDACRAALETFATHGPGVACDKAFEMAGAEIKRVEGSTKSVLPSISKEKRAVVSERLDALSALGTATIEKAIRVLAAIRERVATTAQAMVLPGIRHRFDLVASVLEDSDRPERERARAGAAVLYIEGDSDATSDTWGVIGIVDDDYALRVVLEEFGDHQRASCFHWSERIASLWDDLPFLQGMNLQRGDRPISVTWLDRVNSYVSYAYVLSSDKAPLVLLQPSVACSPLHAIVSLLGLLVLDAVTSSQGKAHALRTGRTYEIDGCFVRFEGTAGPMPGWLTLHLKDGIIYQPPGLASRMIPVDGHRLSSSREFYGRPRNEGEDPMQRFFDWDSAIAPASISSRLVLVASRRRALDLLEGVESNGVHLLDHGLVRFVAAVPDEIETHSTLILVVPSLSAARLLLDRGIQVQAVLVDGYERLYRGRHELPFLMNRPGAPPIINWSASGYYPTTPPTWLPEHKRLEVSSDDLVSILELDDTENDITHSSLWEAATGMQVQPRTTLLTESESVILSAIDAYLKTVRSLQDLPEYWRYHLTALAKTLQILVASTPAEWSEIRRFADSWSSSTDEKWSTLRASALSGLLDLREAERWVLQLLGNVSDIVNSRALGLSTALSERAPNGEQWYFVCDRPEQAKVVASLVRTLGLRTVEPVLLRDLAVCSNCVVAGWVSTSFARRLWAHTPRTLLALVDEGDRSRWQRVSEAQGRPVGQSLLGSVDRYRSTLAPPYSAELSENPDEASANNVGVEWDEGKRVPCVFLWITNEPEAKVLARDGRVIVEEGDVVAERVSARLRPDDRVILGLGSGRWSPAEDFTGAVVAAVESSHPELVETAKEWRCALRQLRNTERFTTMQIRARLASVGVQREIQTIEGWIDLDRPSPISPRGLRKELTAVWPLIGQLATHSLDDVIAACARLRGLRNASGRALMKLWKGRTVELDIDEAWLDELVERLRQEVQVYEVEAVTLGEVPAAMLGWWISPMQARRFESESAQTSTAPEGDGAEDEQNPES